MAARRLPSFRGVTAFSLAIALLVGSAAGLSVLFVIRQAVQLSNSISAQTATILAAQARAYAAAGVSMAEYARKLYEQRADSVEVRVVSAGGDIYPNERPGDETSLMVRVIRASIYFDVRPAVAVIPGGRIVVVARPAYLAQQMAPVAIWVALIVLVAAFAARSIALRVVARATSSVDAVSASLTAISRGEVAPLMPVDAFDPRTAASLAACNKALAAISESLGAQREASLRMQQFTADAGHELRTPLTILMGYLDVIARGAVSDPASVNEILQKMRSEARSMRAVINDLIYLARLDAAVEASRQLVDVSDLVRQAANAVGLSGVLAESLTPAFALGNPNELLDAFRNVLDNARKHGAEPIRADVRVHEGRVSVSVHDSGTGIDRVELARVFDRFFRGSGSDGVEGHGLGLAIAKRAVERSNGTIRMACDAGTTVTIELPRVDATTT